MNAYELSGIEPGTSALLNRKVWLSQKVLNKYGLDGDRA